MYINPHALLLDQLKAGMGHTILLLDAWMKEFPYSDRVTRNTLHSHNLPR